MLEEQDRSRWNREQIAEALPLVRQALIAPDADLLTLQAAIAAEHCKAGNAEETDWKRIVDFYDRLASLQPSPVVSLNRAVAVGMAQGAPPALVLIDDLIAAGDLDGYHLLHAARADMLRRVGAAKEAAKSYERALSLVTNDSERRFLERRLHEVEAAAT